MSENLDPRLPALADRELSPETAAILADWPYNLHRTLAHSPRTLLAWMPYAEHILRENALTPRDREIVVLRVAWNCQSNYEWGLHERLARSLGLDDADIEAICEGAGSKHWKSHETALVQAVDDIQTQWRIGEKTWHVLAEHYAPSQLVDLIYLVGQFITVAIQLNSLQIQVEEGVSGLPDFQPNFTRAGTKQEDNDGP